jgi:nitroreductase
VEAEPLTMLDAAHWPPSSFNAQPWRFLYARRDTQHWDKFLDLL